MGTSSSKNKKDEYEYLISNFDTNGLRVKVQQKEECPICLEEKNIEEMVEFPGNCLQPHYLCLKCFNHKSYDDTQCPICRKYNVDVPKENQRQEPIQAYRQDYVPIGTMMVGEYRRSGRLII